MPLTSHLVALTLATTVGAAGHPPLAFADVPALVSTGPGAEPAVDVRELGELGMLITPRVVEAVTPVLTEAEIDPGGVTIGITFLDADNFEYAIRVVLEPGKTLDTAPMLKACRGCMTEQLVEAAEEAVREAVRRHRERQAKMEVTDPAAAEEPAEGPAEGVVPAPTTEAPMDDEPSPARKSGRWGALGWAGVGALAVGVASAATGAGFLAVGETRPKDDKSQFRDLEPPGFGLVGVGGALVITGVALIVVDRVRARRAKTGQQAAMLVPVVGLEQAGFAVLRRF